MTILLPVISLVVDEIILEFLTQNQYEDQLYACKDFPANENNNNVDDKNNNSKIDDNNNNRTTQDEFEEVLYWADEPWTPCDDVEVPDWAKVEDLTTDDFISELVWTEEPWIQEPLVGLPSWMFLPGIDDVAEVEVPVVNSTVDDDEDDAGIEINNWCDEPYFQTPLDVPRWALLPGIDFPVRHGNNSPYWRFKLNTYINIRQQFGRKMFAPPLPMLLEERVMYNNYGQSKLCVPPPHFNIRYRRF